MPSFDEILAQVLELLQRDKRVAYRVLKRRFALDDEYVEDLKADLIDAKRVAVDEEGKVLVWTGDPEAASSPSGLSATPLSAPSTQPVPAEAERRQLTVMFCDLVGSTALSEQLDPEELREVVRAYQESCVQVIERFEGHVAQYLGDGLLVYFGYPTAHEDDAPRAVRAGLGIMEELHALNPQLSHPIQVRVGIHTGQVVVGEIGSGRKREQLALGETPNLASRVQAIAEPDTVVISPATYRLIQGLFECQDLGLQELKGVSVPTSVYHILREGTAHSRFEVAVRTGLTPLVGREQEVGLLLERWQRVKEGEGQAVLISGEAGVGKSRTVQELKERVAQEEHIRVECHCSPYYQNTAFYPVTEHLQRLLRLDKKDTPEEKLTKLEKALESYGFALKEVVPLFASLLSLPLPDRYSPLTFSPQKHKEKTLEAMVRWLLKEAERQPVRLDIEDVHWADPSTLEFLSLLIEQIPTAPILVLLTFRPEFSPPWAMHSHVSQIILSRLSRRQVGEMAEKVTGGKALPTEVVQQIVTKTDGVPLFVEELTKMVVESGLLQEVEGRYELTGPLPSLAIPTTLQDSLMARLDRLARAKEVAQLGATLGREFSYELIHAVSPLDEPKLQQGLRQLVEAEVLYQRGLPPQSRYVFKHALIQDAAYESLLTSTRQQFHQQIAQVLQERFPETVETQPELVAHHYTMAGLGEQALPYWQQAGQQATQSSAYAEAISHLTQGLAVLKTLPDTPQRAQHELMLLIALGAPLIGTKGWGAPEIGLAYTRARELCQQLGETPQLFPVLFGLQSFYTLRGELTTARELAEQMLSLAQSVQDPDLLLVADFTLGYTLFFLGELVQARAHIEHALTLYNPQQHHALAFHYGQDLGVAGLCFAAYLLWLQGYPEQALTKLSQALSLAEELSHPFSLAMALFHRAQVHLLRREEQATQESVEACLSLSTEQGFSQFLAMGAVTRGWALIAQGGGQEVITPMRESLAALQATGAKALRPILLAFLAEGYGRVGQTEEGLALVAEDLSLVNETEQRWLEAELYRLKGKLLLAQEGKSEKDSESEACFHKAIDIARRQEAKSWELRATISLARLWQQQGKKDEARQVLAEVYNWFTEGFDTLDLKEAKALLTELGG